MEDTNQKVDLSNRNRNVIMFTSASLIIVIVAIVFFLTSGDSQYEKGDVLLKQKQYSEALAEFQKVTSSDKEFRMAQSKINYINGLRAFNEGLKQEAKVHLVKVTLEDEYYHEAQLMLEKINTRASNTQTELELLRDAIKKDRNSRDTIVIKQEVTGTQQPNVKGIEPRSSDEQIDKLYVSYLDKVVNKFESLYQSSRTAGVESKKNYLKDMDSVYSEFVNPEYNSYVKDATVLALKSLVRTWIESRMTLVERLISENSADETITSRPPREEGDKIYGVMMIQLRKVKSVYSL